MKHLSSGISAIQHCVYVWWRLIVGTPSWMPLQLGLRNKNTWLGYGSNFWYLFKMQACGKSCGEGGQIKDHQTECQNTTCRATWDVKSSYLVIHWFHDNLQSSNHSHCHLFLCEVISRTWKNCRSRSGFEPVTTGMWVDCFTSWVQYF